MKRKLTAALLATALSVSFLTPIEICSATETENIVSDAVDSTNENIFLFRNLSWWDAKATTEKLLVAEGAEILQAAFENNILRMSGIDYTNSTSGKDRVDGGGIVVRYSGLNVAGYVPSETQACYIYTLNDDGTINKDTDSAQFYFGWYTFESRDYADGEGVYNDLLQKLQSLYGSGVIDSDDDYFTTASWFDNDNNQIRLLLGAKNNDYTYVTLGYMAANADERLDEMQAAVNAEAIANEAIEREKNKLDVSGL